MLRELTIRDFVIVRCVTLTLDQGFHVLTGETGAGKSILIDALSLVLGARANADVVRPGAERADIQAVIEPTSKINEWLTANDLDQSDEELILRRIIDKQGKSRAYINGVAVTIAQLREIGAQAVDIHGQHAHQSLMHGNAQRDLLDAHCHLIDLKTKLRDAWVAWQDAVDSLRSATEGAQQREERIESLSWQARELGELAIKPGEWQQVTEEHARLSNGQSLLELTGAALAALDDDEAGASRALGRALESIKAASRHDGGLDDVLQSIESAEIAVAQATSDLNRYIDTFDLDPDRLQVLDDRMQTIFSAARKYRCEPEELPDRYIQIQQELDSLSQDCDVETLQIACQQTSKEYQKLARQLSLERQKGAKVLSELVTAKMQSLGMPGGKFEIVVAQSDASAYGTDKIGFMVSGHEGVATAPLSKVASGGELSRISLALSVVASQATEIPTLVFDEVDSGVSGAVAEMVGRLLKQLGARHQVLCITHLPQVAACAEHHYRVAKQKTSDGEVVSHLSKLDEKEKIQAVAELLGGLSITATTLKHAKELINKTT